MIPATPTTADSIIPVKCQLLRVLISSIFISIINPKKTNPFPCLNTSTHHHHRCHHHPSSPCHHPLTTFSQLSPSPSPGKKGLVGFNPEQSVRMHMLRYSSPPNIIGRVPFFEFPRKASNFVVCAAKGPRPRYPRVWKTKPKIGTVSKSLKLVECIKGLSNVKEEVYGALDSFIAWDLEFPLITVKKALKALEYEKEWKRIIQVTKWMLSKGQGRTMGSYYLLLYALAEDGRIDEAEELWTKLFSDNLESMPRIFFDRMIAIYYRREMHDKMFEVFADMEELGIRPTVSIVNMVGDVFQKLGMLDKYQKLKKKYPPPKWEYRYIKGKRIKVRSQNLKQSDNGNKEADDFSDENGASEVDEPSESVISSSVPT